MCTGAGRERLPSAAQLAAELGDRVPAASTVGPEAFRLVLAVRRLVEAVVLTDVDPAARAAAATAIDELTATLRGAQRDDAVLLVRHEDGRLESLTQAAAGRLNPQALPIEWVHRPTEPPAGTPPSAVEVRARCAFTAAHAGSPGRVHGGVVALALDEVAGVALRAAGAGGFTVALDVTFRGPVPHGRPVDVAARWTRSEGRRSFATADVTVDGDVRASADATYVAPRAP